jgi:eukaryotic-like serine/threonine-protein kinase
LGRPISGDQKGVIVQTQQWAMPTPLGEGSVLAGRYCPRRLLGRGGMAEVYLAQDRVMGRPVAVKVFPSRTGSASDAKRQQQEAELLASLNHPGLVTVFDAGVDPDLDRPFLVMEFVAGPTLAARLASGPLDEAQAREVGGALAQALAFVHERGVVHRDVKPSNVLFADPEDYESIKLADFGIARTADSARLTQAGLIVGSAHYLSPEQALGADAGPASDVYALGLVLLECLTGDPAFPGAGIAAAAARLHHDPQIPAGINPDLGRLLRAMTSREPAQRPTAQQVATVLSRAAPSIEPPFLESVMDWGGTTSPIPAPPFGARGTGWGRHWAWVAAACTAVIVAVGGSAALLAHPPSPDRIEPVVQSPASPDTAQVSPAAPTTTPSAPAVQPVAQPDAAAELGGDDDDRDGGRGNDDDDAGEGDANGHGRGKDNGKGGGERNSD